MTGSRTEEYNGFTYSYSSGASSSLIALPVIFFLLAFSAMAVLPHAMFSKYRGKFWSTQAVLYGMEGVPDIVWLERQLFGFSEGRLTWSPHGSTLSQHRTKEGSGARLEGECEALAPLLGNEKIPPDSPAEREESSLVTDDGTRIFTLVDTYAMTVTAFRAKHPPTVALVLYVPLRNISPSSYSNRSANKNLIEATRVECAGRRCALITIVRRRSIAKVSCACPQKFSTGWIEWTSFGSHWKVCRCDK